MPDETMLSKIIKRNGKLLCLLLMLITILWTKTVYSQLYTTPAQLIKTDKFEITLGIIEHYTKGSEKGAGSVYVWPFILHLGLTERVEFKGIFPYIQLRQEYISEIETFGDIIIYLKFDIAKFRFSYPSFISAGSVRNFLDFVTGFDIATGPSREENDEFAEYSTGLPDWRVGFLYGHYFRDLYIDLNFIYVFASYQGEDYLPFSSEIFSTSKNSYLFDIHKVIVKFLWPGKYPWADKEAPAIDKYPHSDDYFMFNASLNYNFYPSFTLFDYGLFLELNWLQSFHKVRCLRQTELLLTPGLQVYASGSTTILGCVSFPIDDREYYFDIKYFLGVMFML